MIFRRTILQQLKDWTVQSDRKPLILRGARQVERDSISSLRSSKIIGFIP